MCAKLEREDFESRHGTRRYVPSVMAGLLRACYCRLHGRLRNTPARPLTKHNLSRLVFLLEYLLDLSKVPIFPPHEPQRLTTRLTANNLFIEFIITTASKQSAVSWRLV